MRVVLLVGLPGSGKSTYLQQVGTAGLSSDTIRGLLADDETDQSIHDRVFQTMRYLLRHRLAMGRPVTYIDATNLTPQERHSWIKLAKDFQYDVQAVYFDVPLDVCLERNQKRSRVVGEDVVKRMSAKLKPPAFEEGFTKITVVRVKKKDSEIAEEAEQQ